MKPHFTGTGFPRDFYLNYHMYRHLFPTMALAMDARYRAHANVLTGQTTVREQVTVS